MDYTWIHIGFAVLIWLAFLVQWALVAWIVVGAREERKELLTRTASLLETLAASAGGRAGPLFPPILTVTNPDTLEDVTFTHLGNGQYGPPETPQPRQNLVEQVEGRIG